jgi:DivIVA domain-containing protein
MPMPWTGEQLRQLRFRKPPIGKRGYRSEDVDAFLARVAAAFDRTGVAVRGSEVHGAAFTKPPIGKRGYDEAEVDAVLDGLERECEERFGR